MPRHLTNLIAKTFASRQTSWLESCRLVFHIGLHKTGTTYLQQQFSAAQQDLKERGLLFPTTGLGMGIFAGPRSGKMAGHIDFWRLFDTMGWGRGALVMTLLALEARSADCHTILISSENTSLVRNPDQSSLGRFFLQRFQKVDILVYLRRWDRWIESLYKEMLGGGETRDFQTFLSEEAWMLDYPARLTKWQNLCRGPIRLHVFDYDEVVRNSGLFEGFFRDVFPGVPALGKRATVSANPSINATQAEALRQFNIANRHGPGRWEKLDTFTEADSFLHLHGPSGFFDEETRNTFLSGFRSQNKLLEEQYGINLIGK